MERRAGWMAFVGCGLVAMGISRAEAAEPDSRIVLHSGMEVRGVMLGFEGGFYDVELADGRRLRVAMADVERIERLALAPPPPAPVPAADPAPAAPAADPPLVALAERPLASRCEGSILVTETTVDPSFYTLVAHVKDKKAWHGVLYEMYPRLADMARVAHADAVVDVRVWTAWSTTSPHATGKLVRWNDKARTTPLEVSARCF